MKIWLFSDTHLEFGFPFDHTPPEGTDVIVVLGDFDGYLMNALRSLSWLITRVWQTELPVFYVAGNHDFYNACLDDQLKQAEAHTWPPNLHFLNDDFKTINGVRFMGGTLWTDYGLMGPPLSWAMRNANDSMNDHRLITTTRGGTERRFRPDDARELHFRTLEAFNMFFGFDSTIPTVILTHHLPHPNCIDPKFHGSLLNAAFASDLSAFLADREPLLWLHGHTHSPVDISVGPTRIVCNPRGYPTRRGLENPNFNPQLLVEL